MNALDLLYIPVALATAPAWARKKRSGWRERFGHVQSEAEGPAADGPAREPRRGRVLLHAVSVGEVGALRDLVPALAARAEVVVSATTDTGLARARELFGASCAVVRYPLDFSWAVRRFLDAVRPDAVGLVELELWPNFIRECARRGIPVGIVNGRLSERSFRGYSRIRRWISRDFARLAFADVQDADYAARFEAMGVPRDRVHVTGSMKWDSARITDHVPEAARLASELGIDPSRPLIVAGSTGPLRPTEVDVDGRRVTVSGEEALLHAVCPAGVQLLCAPRKPERFAEAAAALPGAVRRSERGPPRRPTDRFLLDTIGELRAAYSLATVVVVGRSFGDLYGSDPIEPIALGKPTVIGPSVSDFATVVEALERGGGLARASVENLASVLRALLADPGRRSELADRGRGCICSQQGASKKHAEMLAGLLRNGATAVGAHPRPERVGVDTVAV